MSVVYKIAETRGSLHQRRAVVLHGAGQTSGEEVRNYATTLRSTGGREAPPLSAALLSFAQRTFLPEGYPDSVTGDYLIYQVWDTLQALCSSVTGTLSTRSILRGVGVGSSEATLASGVLSWVLRDGVAMVSRLLFASAVATDLDYDAKRWRYVADITNDIALTLEVFASYLSPTWFLLSVCVASLFKAVTGVAGGSARASLTQHFARRQNTADLSAKEGSQETLAGLLGMLIGTAVAYLVPDASFWGTLVVFVSCTCMHLVANYMGVRSLLLTYFNRQRLAIVTEHFLRQQDAAAEWNTTRSRKRSLSASKSRRASSRSRSPSLSSRQSKPPASPQKTASADFLSPCDVQRLEGILSYHSLAATAIPSDVVLGDSLSKVLDEVSSLASDATVHFPVDVEEEATAASKRRSSSKYSSAGRLDSEASPDVERVLVCCSASLQAKGFALVVICSHGNFYTATTTKYRVIFSTAQPEAGVVLRAFFDILYIAHAQRRAKLLLASDDFQSVQCRVSDESFRTFYRHAQEVGWKLDRAQLRLGGWATRVVVSSNEH